MGRPAVFLDRDGTLIESVHYLSRPDQVRLLPGAAEAVRAIRAAGYLCIVVTNQAAIAKGLLTHEGLVEVQRELERLLAAEGAALDGWYYSPHAMQGTCRETVEHPDRKPGPGLLLRAARELDVALAESWMVGDAVSDTLAGRNAGCHATVLVRSGLARDEIESHPSVDHVLDSLADLPPLLTRGDA